jgi:iron complex outermembrane receptor protein
VYINDTPGRRGRDRYEKYSVFCNRRVEGVMELLPNTVQMRLVNIILKKQTNYTEVSLTSGVTSQGDGFNFGADLNSGFKIADKVL